MNSMQGTVSLVFVTIISIGSGFAQVGPGTDCICYEDIANGTLYNPTAIGHLSDGSGRLLVAEQRGIIWIYSPDGTKLETPFLNISDPILGMTSLGLYNFAPHPDYASNGRLFLHYTIREGGDLYQRISEMNVSADPNVLDSETETILMDVPYDFKGPWDGHHGGGLLFGDDGLLYIFLGDGYCCHDPLQNAQNKSSPLGATLRVDVDSRTGNLPYGIPPSNHFLEEPEAVPEMYAYGIRNPYTASMDQGDRITGEGRGRISFGDVGEDTYEEINEVLARGNYGWPNWEATLCHQPEECPTMGSVVEPSVYYNRSVGVCVIYGGVYRGCMNPDLSGWMLFGDYGSSYKWGAIQQPDDSWSTRRLPGCQTCPDGSTNDPHHFIQGWGMDESGEHYIAAQPPLVPQGHGGSVFRIVDPSNRATPCAPGE